jgi:methionyl-tRNA synthetase
VAHSRHKAEDLQEVAPEPGNKQERARRRNPKTEGEHMQDQILEMAKLLNEAANENRKEKKHWGDLGEKEQATFLSTVKRVLLAADKLNLCLKPVITETETKAGEALVVQNIDTAEGIIKEFVKKLTHPRGVSEFFPCRELAARIVRG